MRKMGLQAPDFNGELAERSNAAVLKTASPSGLGGSNPSLSASPGYQNLDFRFCQPRRISSNCSISNGFGSTASAPAPREAER
jgi:hypothetical protein